MANLKICHKSEPAFNWCGFMQCISIVHTTYRQLFQFTNVLNNMVSEMNERLNVDGMKMHATRKTIRSSISFVNLSSFKLIYAANGKCDQGISNVYFSVSFASNVINHNS